MNVNQSRATVDYSCNEPGRDHFDPPVRYRGQQKACVDPKRKDFEQAKGLDPLSCGYERLVISVPGIITSVQSHILKTDSVIVDALLGQGEALDCYNMRLQEEASRAAELRNSRYEAETSQEAAKITAALATIAAITDPVLQADAYKKMFGSCCSMDELNLILNPAP